MADLITGPFSDRIVGYCTNVHAGTTLKQMKSNFDTHAQKVRQQFCPEDTLGIGLWLPACEAESIVQDNQIESFNEWLNTRNLEVFTINGFPYGDFHQSVVKHAVYVPDWTSPEREAYTKNLITILAGMLPEESEGSISTLPVAWDGSMDGKSGVGDSGVMLKRTAQIAHVVELHSGRLIHIDLEPEPGCILQRSDDVIDYFSSHLLSGEDIDLIRSHLRICHDICHTAVMFEDQADMFRRYDESGIKVGKVQVSNAIRVDFDALCKDEKVEALQQLKAFEEDRYLHQTCIRDNATGEITFHEDLPLATKAAEERGEPIGEWRVHFHVPIYLESFGLLQTTRNYIDDCLELMKAKPEVKHFEVETYAWNVLPPELQKQDLAEGIADELIWLRDRMPGISP